jgi:hypothetical protein
MSIFSCNSIKTFDFYAHYTNIPHSKEPLWYIQTLIKDRKTELVQLCFTKKRMANVDIYLVLGKDAYYSFKKNNS